MRFCILPKISTIAGDQLALHPVSLFNDHVKIMNSAREFHIPKACCSFMIGIKQYKL